MTDIPHIPNPETVKALEDSRAGKTHSTHKMRYSDSSYYDEICDACMQPDPNTHTNVKLTEPCTKESD
jgi:hypothetical protein